MYSANDPAYQQTRSILLGEEKLKPEFAALSAWIDEAFGVRPINIVYGTSEKGRPLLRVCFEFENEAQLFFTSASSYFDTTKQKMIGDRFREIIHEQGLAKTAPGWLGFPAHEQQAGYITDNIFVLYHAFAPIAKQEAVSQITASQVEQFTQSLNCRAVWMALLHHLPPTIFLYTYEQQEQYSNSETLNSWTEKFYDLVKPYDGFDYFLMEKTQLYLDSKENFDSNYHGQWHEYYS